MDGVYLMLVFFFLKNAAFFCLLMHYVLIYVVFRLRLLVGPVNNGGLVGCMGFCEIQIIFVAFLFSLFLFFY